MPSCLHTVPSDVLQHIAFLAASSAVLEPPVGILRLMQTHSCIRQSLDIGTAPHVYAETCASKFDTASPRRRYRSTLTNSALAAELSNRCRLLQRAKRLDFTSDEALLQDLWTALWMLLESDGLNEQQLDNVNFPEFILGIARTHLGATSGLLDHRPTALEDVVVWLLCLALPRSVILNMLKEHRDELYGLIFPYIFRSQNKACSYCSLAQDICVCPSQAKIDSATDEAMQVKVYNRLQRVEVPDPSVAAINLACVILEATPLKIPYHLPETRPAVIHGQYPVPTKNDYRTLGRYATPLFADSMPRGTFEKPCENSTELDVTRSTLHDLEFRNILKRTSSLDAPYCFDTVSYTAGTMTGVWEGLYRIVPTPISPFGSSMGSNPLTSVVLVKPIQCALTEYICDDVPCPVQDDTVDFTDFPSDVFDGVQLVELTEVNVRGRKYRKHFTPSVGHFQRDDKASCQPQDVLLLGETLVDHDEAWGAFKFCGKVYSDGRVVLMRESKVPHGDQGLWVFEGCLRVQTTVVGRWRMTGTEDNVDHGVFSLGRALAKWQN